MKRVVLLVGVVAILGWMLLLINDPVEATLSSCSASVSPVTMQTSQTVNFSFTLNNTGSSSILYFKVTSPSSNVSISGKSASGWSSTSNSSYAEFWGGSIAAGDSLIFTITAVSGTSEMSSQDWTVVANDVLSSSGTTGCTGSLGVAVSGVTDVTAPTITSSITVTEISDSTAKINWTTDEAATSLVWYGLTESVTDSKEDTSLVTSHGVTIDGLVASTTYIFYVVSADAGNYSVESDYGSFTTAVAGTTNNPTPTPTATPGPAAPTATPTPVPVEKVPPVVRFSTSFTDSYEVAPTIEGVVTDNVGVTSIDYSIDGGDNWLPVDYIEDYGAKSTSYSFTPLIFEDGNFEVRVRAADGVGNIGYSTIEELVVDRLPPRVGGYVLALGPHPLLPNKEGVIITVAGVSQKVTLSAVGGATSIDLLAGEKMFSLSNSPDTGLWKGAIDFKEPGIYELSVRAEDGAGNKTERRFGKVLVLRPGKIVDGSENPIKEGEVKLFYKEPRFGFWTLWDAKSFGQENPQEMGSDGGYHFFLPPGKYYMQVKAPGYKTVTTKIFEVKESTPLNAMITMEKGASFLAGIFEKRADVVIRVPEIPKSLLDSDLLESKAFEFELPTLDGDFDLRDLDDEPFLLSFVNTWSPTAVEQVSILDELIYNRVIKGAMVVTQQDLVQVESFRRRGRYRSDFVVDKDGDIVDEYEFSSIPTHYFLAPGGKIVRIVSGVLSESEIKAELNEAR